MKLLRAAATGLVLAALAGPAAAQPGSEDDAAAPDSGFGERNGDYLKPRAWEFGAGGAFTNYGGPTYGTFEMRVGRFAGAGTHGLVGLESMLGYTSANGTNVGDLLFAASYQFPFYLEGLTRRRGATWPYFGLVAGVSQAWSGPVEDTRYPLGGYVGVRMMPNKHSAIRFEARFVSEAGVDESAFVGSQVRSGYFVVYSFAIVNPKRPPGP
jgi:hypothetical protein